MKVKSILFISLLIMLFVAVHSAAAVNFQTPVIKILPDTTFSDNHDLRVYTELSNPQWTYTIKVNGHGQEITSSGSTLTISGFALAYPTNDNDVVVSYSLTGTVPSVSATGNKTFFEIYETDSSGDEVSGAPTPLTEIVVNPSDVSTLRSVVETSLSDFNNDIQMKANSGVDVTEAQKKYDKAEQLIEDSTTASYGDANEMLQEAKNTIKERVGAQ